MEEYKKGHACEKCGERDAKSEFKGTLYLGFFYVSDNIIKRTCRNCGYVWHETPIKEK